MNRVLERLDARACDRVSGPAWSVLYDHFCSIHSTLIGVSPDVSGNLTTIYIKYDTPALPRPFAVVWVKKASEIIVGLALPEGEHPTGLAGPPPGCKYAGLTAYFKVAQGGTVPPRLSEWAALAFGKAQKQ